MMKNGMSRTLWRKDLAEIPPTERRVARYALQLYRTDRWKFLDLGSTEVLVALWRLTLPLIDSGELADLLQHAQAAEARRSSRRREHDEESFEDPTSPFQPGWMTGTFFDSDDTDTRDLPDVLRKPVRTLFESLPESLLARLAVADGTDPTSAVVANLGTALGLSTLEVQILDFLEHRGSGSRSC